MKDRSDDPSYHERYIYIYIYMLTERHNKENKNKLLTTKNVLSTLLNIFLSFSLYFLKQQ